jgi:hypothetical protein
VQAIEGRVFMSDALTGNMDIIFPLTASTVISHNRIFDPLHRLQKLGLGDDWNIYISVISVLDLIRTLFSPRQRYILHPDLSRRRDVHNSDTRARWQEIPRRCEWKGFIFGVSWSS